MITQVSEHKHHFTVRSHECDIHNSASLNALSNYMQDAARAHVEELKFGVEQLRQEQKYWVLSRKFMQIERYPKHGQNITVITWPKGIDKLFAIRDFEIWQGQEIICKATSSWALLDLKLKRPAPVTDIGTVMFEREHIHAIEDRPNKLGPATPSFNVNHRVTYSELDLNGHVNNTRHINWMMDTFSTAYHRTHIVARVQTNYIAEVFPDQDITIYRQDINSNQFLFEIKALEGKTLFRGELTFKPINHG